MQINADGTSTTVMSGLAFPGGIAFDADGNAYITTMVSLPATAPAGGMVLKCEADAFHLMTTMPVASPEGTPAG